MSKDWEADLLARANGQPINADEDSDANDDEDDAEPEPAAVSSLIKLYNHLSLALEHGQGELMSS